MRIIAGKLRGRKLIVPAGCRVRPTGDRMKESMFSALGGLCRDARVLDLFAGSGALGLEALSRGAASGAFVDKSRTAVHSLKENVRALGVNDQCDIVCAEASKVFDWWLEHRCRESILVLESPAKEISMPVDVPARVLKTARFGESTYSIYLAE